MVWRVVVSVILALHGLIHLLGFIVYLKLAELEGLSYPESLLGGRIGASGGFVKFLGLLWLLAGIGFGAVIAGLLIDRSWWQPVLIGTVTLSLFLTVLGWPDARAGVFSNVAILLVALGLFIAP